MSPSVEDDTGVRVVRQGFATLRHHRYVVYLGGLVAVTLASALVPTWARTPLVVAALTLMCTTYLAELHGRTTAVRAETVVVATAVAGVAVGSYVLVEVSRVGGLLFVLGGILFFRATVDATDDGGSPSGDPEREAGDR